MITNLLNEIKNLLGKEGNTEFIEDGIKFSVNVTNDGFSVKAETIEDKFDDSEIKEMAEEYKNIVAELNDDIFVETTEQLAKELDLKEFNRLLDLKSFTKEEADNLGDMIDTSTKVYSKYLKKSIQDLIQLYEKF